MASAPQSFDHIRTVEIEVVMAPGLRPVKIRVPAATKQEAYALLESIGNGGMGGIAYGSVLSPIRNAYKANLASVEREIAKRYTQLGSGATPAQIEQFSKWATAQRTRTARIWRLPLPVTGTGLEIRDWRVYGRGGRTFPNMVRHANGKGFLGPAAHQYLIGSATRSNLKVNNSVARGARVLKGGGVVGLIGLGFTAKDIYDAPAGQRGQVAQRHAVGIAGGMVGAELFAGAVTIGAGLLLATPPGWLIIAVGVVGGVAGGIAADRYFYPEDHHSAARTLSAGRVLQCTPSNPLGSPLTARARR